MQTALPAVSAGSHGRDVTASRRRLTWISVTLCPLSLLVLAKTAYRMGWGCNAIEVLEGSGPSGKYADSNEVDFADDLK
ncbi:hypothetical protein DPEC_G00367430 [Dallia pectoralis]|nr:hypothetical protein DPEC_G00367430 [Dallia pectoralis]